MSQLPLDFISSISNVPECDHNKLLTSLQTPPIVSIRVNPLKKDALTSTDFLSELEQIPWCKEGYYMTDRPIFTLDPFFHAGAYYVQEASSMLTGFAFTQLFENIKHLRILDVCAAPGGKSTHVAACIDETSLLVSNEIIRNRAMILSENIQKWGNQNTIVTNGDPKYFGKLNGYFDAIIIDAPCSGEGMFRKDKTAINEWSLNNVQLCISRQKQIISDVWNSLKEDGIIFYSTCTFNPKENEEIAEWMIDKLGAESIKIEIEDSWGITPVLKNKIHSLRCYPYKCKGEGFSLMILRKTSKCDSFRNIKGNRFFTSVSKPIEAELKYLFTNNNVRFIQNNTGELFSIPNNLENEIADIGNITKVVHAGTPIGNIKGKDFIPHHGLAFSTIINTEHFNFCDITKETALQYFSKTAFTLPDSPNGWILLRYVGLPIGFVKNLGNRVNNIYPMEWRIRMKI